MRNSPLRVPGNDLVCLLHIYHLLQYMLTKKKKKKNFYGFLEIIYTIYIHIYGASQVALVVESLPASARDARDTGLIPGSGPSPGEGSGSPLPFSSLENPTDRGAWQATVHGVAESDMTEHLSMPTCTHIYTHTYTYLLVS